MDEEEHGQGQHGVEASPEVQEALHGLKALLEQGVVAHKDLQTTSRPTERLLVEAVEGLRGKTGGKVLVDSTNICLLKWEQRTVEKSI